MKTKLSRFALLVFTVVFIQSCFSTSEDEVDQNNGSGNIQHSSDHDAEMNEVVNEAPVKIEDMDIEEKAKEVLQKRVDNSPFRNLECCESDNTRFDDCCCEKVLEKYKNLVEKNALGDLNLKDQILIDCRKGPFSAKFDEVDFPEGEDEYGDI